MTGYLNWVPHEIFNTLVEKFTVEKFLIEKSGVENFMVEKSGVEAWG